MNINKYIEQVNLENIYQTVIDLEGPKHPLYNWDALENAATYIKDKLEGYGVTTKVHEFYLEEFDKPFKNIIGYIGDPNKSAILIGSHYDSVEGAPGANDNLSAVAVSLEIARILMLLDNPPPVIIAVFTLEEGHPTKEMRIRDALRNKGWLDHNNRYTSFKISQTAKNISKVILKELRKTRFNKPLVYETVIKDNKEVFTDIEMEYILTLQNVILENEKLTGQEKISSFLPGSSRFAEKVINDNIDIEFVIVYDCLGWVSSEENTQKPLPLPEKLLPYMSFHKTDLKSNIGNYIVIMGEQNSKKYVDEFAGLCREDFLDIPHISIHLPLDFKSIYKVTPDVLRSDHAPFWEAEIPGLFISDGANFRSPYYHTGEDKSIHIDFNRLNDITKATIKLILERK